MRFAEPARHWLRAQFLSREIDALDPETISQLARDNALAESDFRELATSPDTNAELLRQQLAQAGIDPDKLAHTQASVMRDMAVICSGCSVARRCRRTLNRQDAVLHYSQYCPNAHTIDALRVGSTQFD